MLREMGKSDSLTVLHSVLLNSSARNAYDRELLELDLDTPLDELMTFMLERFQ